MLLFKFCNSYFICVSLKEMLYCAMLKVTYRVVSKFQILFYPINQLIALFNWRSNIASLCNHTDPLNVAYSIAMILLSSRIQMKNMYCGFSFDVKGNNSIYFCHIKVGWDVGIMECLNSVVKHLGTSSTDNVMKIFA